MRIIEGEKFFKTQEVAEMLDLTPQTVRSYVRQGRITGRRVGNSYLISKSNLMSFLGVGESEKARTEVPKDDVREIAEKYSGLFAKI